MDDQLIRDLYVVYDIPADALIVDHPQLSAFTYTYNSRRQSMVLPGEIAKRLMQLRKKGHDNGGLPRLRKDENGRKLQ